MTHLGFPIETVVVFVVFSLGAIALICLPIKRQCNLIEISILMEFVLVAVSIFVWWILMATSW